MSRTVVLRLLLDTSYLRSISFADPDFRKLLEFSKDGLLNILIPHVVWEERRTQLAESTYAKVQRLREAVDALRAPWMGGLSKDDLVPPGLSVPDRSEIDSKSREMMADFAAENRIEIVPIAPDHADRAWVRYFNADPPFEPTEERNNRRKDIPDSWIFETAIDLAKQHSDLSALCADGKLSRALTSIRVAVFRTTPEVLEAINKVLVPKPLPAEMPETIAAASEEDQLEAALARAHAPFRDLDRRVLGYIGYLGLGSVPITAIEFNTQL